jgi:hypothetical protein
MRGFQPSMSDVVQLRLNGRPVKPHKCVVSPLLGTRTVLTNSPWGFVALWLKRERKNDALFFWNQAQEFHEASEGMSLASAPLLHYYCFMNATKALLVAKGITFDPHHGVRASNLRKPGARKSLSNEGVCIGSRGILPALSSYLGEREPEKTHTMQEVFFNLPYVHRTYCLTYENQQDLFIPLLNGEFVLDQATMQAYFRAELSNDFAHARYIKRLPASLIGDPQGGHSRVIRSSASITLGSKTLRTAEDRDKLIGLSRALRADIQYINGSQTLWYAKGKVKGPKRLERYPLALTLAAMHRLSELCRYKPMELASFLDGHKNWLLSEFIQLAPGHFIDELSAEITGHQFLVPNVRTAT